MADETTLNIAIEDRASVKLLTLAGELGHDGAGELVETVTGLLIGPRAKLVLDMNAVPYMNSEGLNALVRVAAQANIQEGRIVLASLSPFISGVLQVTKLDRFFEVFPTVAAALTQLAAG